MKPISRDQLIAGHPVLDLRNLFRFARENNGDLVAVGNAMRILRVNRSPAQRLLRRLEREKYLEPPDRVAGHLMWPLAARKVDYYPMQPLVNLSVEKRQNGCFS
jgi:hypothetical protein